MTHDIYARMRDTVLAALKGLDPSLPPEIADRVEVTPARDPAHGDMATNAAMVCAKAMRQPPQKIKQKEPESWRDKLNHKGAGSFMSA